MKPIITQSVEDTARVETEADASEKQAVEKNDTIADIEKEINSKEAKESKSRSRLSIFRKSKKQKKEKSLLIPDDLILNPAGEETVANRDEQEAEQTNDNKISVEDEEITKEIETKTTEAKPKQPRKRVWQRLSWYGKDEDEAAPTMQSTEITEADTLVEQGAEGELDTTFVEKTDVVFEDDKKQFYQGNCEQKTEKRFAKRLWKRKSWKPSVESGETKENDEKVKEENVGIYPHGDNDIFENKDTKVCKRSFVNKIKNRGSWFGEGKQDIKVEQQSQENDSFHDVFEAKKEIDDKAEDSNEAESIVVIPGGVYDGDNKDKNGEKYSVEEQEIVQHNDSIESDLTFVTAIPDTSIEVTLAKCPVPDQCKLPSSPVQAAATDFSELSTTTAVPVETMPLHADTDLSTQSLNDEVTTREENVKAVEVNLTLSEKRVDDEEKKALDYVLVDHLNDRQKDESYQLAKKALKVYRKAQLRNVYCNQACCEIM